MVKRIAALPGQEIEIVDKQLFVDGQRAVDDKAVFRDHAVRGAGSGLAARDNFGPYRVPADSIFVLGDNRDQSYDSRFFGPVRLEAITGEVLYVYWSSDLKRIGRNVR